MMLPSHPSVVPLSSLVKRAKHVLGSPSRSRFGDTKIPRSATEDQETDAPIPDLPTTFVRNNDDVAIGNAGCRRPSSSLPKYDKAKAAISLILIKRALRPCDAGTRQRDAWRVRRL